MSVAWEASTSWTPCQGPDAGEKLEKGERLHQVVIGASQAPANSPSGTGRSRAGASGRRGRRGHAAGGRARSRPPPEPSTTSVEHHDVEWAAVGGQERLLRRSGRPFGEDAGLPRGRDEPPRRHQRQSSTTSTRISLLSSTPSPAERGYASAAAVSGRSDVTAAPNPVRLNGLVITRSAPAARAASRSRAFYPAP